MNWKFLFFVEICAMLLAGCSVEDRYNEAGTGQLSPVLTADFSVPLSTDPTVLTTTFCGCHFQRRWNIIQVVGHVRRVSRRYEISIRLFCF